MGEPPRVLAHRGLALHAPENTLLAFAAAITAGASIIETDVHASADGVAVVGHDPDFARLTGSRVPIAGTLASDLATIDLGADQHPPTLREALVAFPETRFNIDMKSDDAVVPTVRAVLAADATDRVLLTSFSERRRARAKGMLPRIATSASRALILRALPLLALGLDDRLARLLHDVDAVQVPIRQAGVAIVTAKSVRAFAAAGVEVHVWTINDEPTMHELLGLGVHGIVTDRADLAVPLLRSAKRLGAEPAPLRRPSA